MRDPVPLHHDNERGDRVRLVFTSDKYTRLTRGAEGTVRLVDSMGNVHVDWDDGSAMGLIPGEDRWVTIQKGTT